MRDLATQHKNVLSSEVPHFLSDTIIDYNETIWISTSSLKDNELP